MNVIFKEPNKSAKLITIKNFDDIRKILIPDNPIDGMVQAVPIFMNYWLLCDEEARIKDNPPPINISTDIVSGNTILGNIIIVLDVCGDWTSIPDDKVEHIINWLNSKSV